MESVSSLIAPVATRQARAFTTAQAAAVGIDPDALERWVRAGHGRRAQRGIYVAGPEPDSIDTRRWIAVLAGGSGAMLGGLAALSAWGIDPRSESAVEIVVSRRTRAMHGARVIHSRTLDPEDRKNIRGMPVSTVERALVDVAGRRTAEELCKLISEAAFRNRLNRARLRRCIARSGNRAGRVRLERALRLYERGDRGVDSRKERRFLAKLRRAGVRGIRTNVWLYLDGERIRVDYLIEEWSLAIEFDPSGHERPNVRREDRLKTALCAANDIAVIRVDEDRPDEGLEAVLQHIATNPPAPIDRALLTPPRSRSPIGR
ncbi:MAG: hypothetical protein KDC46_01110 [Thermoleophilia bacterium]|nr:hypothetical protein [Thermoleophilia bacterium]